MSQHLTDMAITRVSLVDKGANQRRLAVLKRDGEASMTVQAAERTGLAGLLQKAADALLGKPEPVAKAAETFADIIAGRELAEALDDSWWVLQDAVWSAIYARDEGGEPLALAAKQALVAQSLEEFKAYLLAQMATGITKRDGDPAEAATRQIAAVVAKVGRKISGSRLERLVAASEALNSVLVEVAETVADEGAGEAEEDTVEKAELVAAMAEALEPINKRMVALETAIAKADETEGEDEKLTLEGVAEAVSKLADKIDALAETQGVRKSLAGQDGAGAGTVKKSVFAGILD